MSSPSQERESGTPVGRGGKTRRRQSGIWVALTVAAVALLLALLSLVVNGLLIQRLLATREAGLQMVDAAIAGMDEAALGEVAFAYVFSDTIAYSGTVPISQTIVFPFQGTVPFQGSVPFRGTVPVVINIPILGAQRFNVPVNTNVYVDTSVDVSTTVTVPVTMDFPFEVEMPVRMPIDIAVSLDEQPGLQALLTGLREFLVELRTLFW
ncbi:MAG: hypothetical protein MUF84_09190 [Anaerolineae bacterium]|nr:hypothetical protein [Anaerolineae bacterium]